MKGLILTFLFMTLFSCVPQGDLKSFPQPESYFQGLVSTEAFKGSIDPESDIILLNRDYPVEVVMYPNGVMYYSLDNLGSGSGTWFYESGTVALSAWSPKKLFKMNFQLVAADKDGKRLELRFVDRFGPKQLPVEIITP